MEGFFSSFDPLLKKYKLESILISLALVTTLISGLIYRAGKNPEERANIPTLVKKSISTPSKNILIDLSGSVEHPDVYEVSSGARLKDILILAGGLSQDADRDFFSKNFNLARILQDQEKIYIPNEEETNSDLASNFQPQSQSTNLDVLGASNKVNINTAPSDQLDTLPGIGEVTAQKIIQNRPYSTAEELLSKKVVGKSVYEKIKTLVEP